ncbi:hypothetical protein BDQ17DRAFT_771308 [Cyathus striatus]|nr:hypothetical protein BDQ17DRAFT_1361561 [Cyathus striatus]KAF8998996.1 hypothetical protein BDQ17DRAFT_771308 [Cyathus striatus]
MVLAHSYSTPGPQSQHTLRLPTLSLLRPQRIPAPHDPHLQANILSSNAFSQGVIRSGTVFSVDSERIPKVLDLVSARGAMGTI